jgi:UPF0755 protein
MKKKAPYIFAGLAIAVILFSILVSRLLFKESVFPKDDSIVLVIPTGSSYSDVLDTLNTHLIIKNERAFNWLVKYKKYPDLIKSGRYLVDIPLSINTLINILRSGNQTSVRVTFNNIRTMEQLAGRFEKQLEIDSVDFMMFFSDASNYAKDGFTKENIISIFIPNTYDFFWNTDAKGVYTRMLREYNRFWNSDRMAKAEKLGLSQNDVSILASIIDDEVNKKEEKPVIAGVYLNRLKIGMPLQACPTIKFALNDFTITRVLNSHLTVESPYNTYKYRGLPPGPVGCPSIEGIDATLNAENHDYLFFVAKADFSGYHNFSRTLAQHNRYAAEYQRELNRRRIFR